MSMNITENELQTTQALEQGIPVPTTNALEAMIDRIRGMGLDVPETLAGITDVAMQMAKELGETGKSYRKPHDLQGILGRPIGTLCEIGRGETDPEGLHAACAILRYLGTQFATKGYRVDPIIYGDYRREYLSVHII